MRKMSKKEMIKNIKFYWKKISDKIQSVPVKKYLPKLRFSWGTVLYGVPIFFLLYYPLGAYLSEHIEADTQIEIKKTDQNESDLISAMVYIINKETNEHMWTPNLPIIFPGYILDNMPEFQTGEIKAAANLSRIFAAVMGKYMPEDMKNLNEAAEYLAYSPTVWFFSDKAGKIFAPSSSTQYKKAKKELLFLNNELKENKTAFIYSADDLQKIMNYVQKDLEKTSETIKQYIRENSDKFADFKADNLFYNTKGRLYAYYILLKALGEDYKTVVVDTQIYPAWSEMLKCLEDGISLSPWMIKNSDVNSSFSPNHLAYLNMYILCATGKISSFDFKQKTEE